MNEHEAIWQDIEAVSNLNMDIDEGWRDVVGYEGYYQVSNLGRVRSVRRKGRPVARIMPPRPGNEYGHLSVQLSKESRTKTITVHKLVTAAWIGPKPEGKQVCHGPKGKLDNSVSNLCYGTVHQDRLDMRRDGTHNGQPVRRSDGVEFSSMQLAAEEIGCPSWSIWYACNHPHKRVGGYEWEYIKSKRHIYCVRPVKRSDGAFFVSMSEAARISKISPAGIHRVCNGYRKTAGGYGWEYVNEEIEERDTDAELPGGNNSNREVFTTHQESIQ